MKTILATQLYSIIHQIRFKEILECLYRNTGLPAISQIILFLENKTLYDYAPKHDKITYIYPENRLTFKDSFDYLRSFKKKLYSSEDCLLIAANSDIYFTENDLMLASGSIKKDEAYALSRWDIKYNNAIVHYDKRDSQDTWMFKNDIKPGKYDIPFGKPGCDNRILFELEKAGYTVKNPSKSIKTYHLHKQKFDTYDEADKAQGEYSFKEATFI